MLRAFLQTHSSIRIFLLLITIFSLASVGSTQNQPSDLQDHDNGILDSNMQQSLEKPSNTEKCTQSKPSASMSGGQGAETVKLDDLIDHKEEYYGKTVTVEGEMHRIFTDNVFTIEDDDLLRDDDVLIISDVTRDKAVEALEDSTMPGKDVRVTGMVRAFDRQELECLYGPLHLEPREGHSFTKSPVLIVQKESKMAAPAPELEKPAAVPVPEPAPIPDTLDEPERTTPAAESPVTEPEKPAMDEEESLPDTASGVPLVGLLGVFSLMSGLGLRYFRR
jgi:hypothetical protein